MTTRRRIPQYRLHAATGQARVAIKGRTFYLGKYQSPASWKAYATVIERQLPPTAPPVHV